MNDAQIAVASRSFCMHPVLRAEVLKRYPNTRFNDAGLSLKGTALVEFLQGCEKVITALEILDEATLKQLPDLKVVGKYGVGLDMVDRAAMQALGIKLGWKGGVNKRSVAELTLSAMISLLHRVPFSNQEVRADKWYQVRGKQLTDRVVGIVGCGHVGKDLVKMLKPFGCKVLVNDIVEYPEFYEEHGIEAVSLPELMRRSEIVTLHVPKEGDTLNMITRELLEAMPDGGYFVNYARGGLVDEAGLKDQLASGKLAGVALDVFALEPDVDYEFAKMDNVLVTPHIGGSTEEAVLAMGMAAIDGLDNYCDPMDVG